jgi:hypothetical protein
MLRRASDNLLVAVVTSRTLKQLVISGTKQDIALLCKADVDVLTIRDLKGFYFDLPQASLFEERGTGLIQVIANDDLNDYNNSLRELRANGLYPSGTCPR